MDPPLIPFEMRVHEPESGMEYGQGVMVSGRRVLFLDTALLPTKYSVSLTVPVHIRQYLKKQKFIYNDPDFDGQHEGTLLLSLHLV